MTDFQLPINITDRNLFSLAFTHRSFLNEFHQEGAESNERLEFLGDAVLEVLVSDFLYHKFTTKPEGELTALRAALVRTTTLAAVARQLSFGQYLKMSKGEEQSGGRENTSLLANTFEAVIGAMYLDTGLGTVKQFLSEHLFPLIDDIIDNQLFKDYKSTFQEQVQAMGHPTPTYQLVSQSGPDHDKVFEVALIVNHKTIATGKGKSKQQAQQEAAKSGLEKLADKLKI
jgi:ribonuclease-3